MTIEVKNDAMIVINNENTLHIELIKLQQENQELKAKIKTYEDPEDLTLMFMYCNEKAKDKIKELKKQLEEERDKVREYSYKLCNFRCEETYENQQKEFIEWLEKKIEKLENKVTGEWYLDQIIYDKRDIYQEILSKYREIIGQNNG